MLDLKGKLVPTGLTEMLSDQADLRDDPHPLGAYPHLHFTTDQFDRH